MPVFQTKALILRHTSDREHDRILVVLTPDHGQMRLRARGTKKSVSKLGGSLEPLTEVELMIADGRVMDQVIGSVIRRSFFELRRDVLSLVMAQWLMELVERVTKPGQANPKLYTLVLSALADIGQELDWTPGRRWLALYRQAWNILSHEGFVPSMQRCATCHQVLADGEIMYHPVQGFIHRREAAAGAWRIEPVLSAYLLTGVMSADERQGWRDMRRLLDHVIQHALDRPLASERVLQEVMKSSTRLPLN